MELDLGARDGLPEHLRVLAKLYPRAGWEGHANFDGLTRFWLDRHLMFRRSLAQLHDGTEAFLDNRLEMQRFGAGTGRLADFFLNGLHGHHQIEDQHYFPQLIGLDSRLAAGFALLDADHHALDGHIHSLAQSTNALLGAIGGPGKPARGQVQTEAGKLHKALTQFGVFLNRHLEDEEELVVPVILHHAAQIKG